ncbi:MAG: hypothetical protein QM733_04575 [Ilumatobacteraceae bacterium]
MDRPLSLDELRTAVAHLNGAIVDHHPITDDQWDHAISTLLVAREQHGGRVRQLLQMILHDGSGHPEGQLGRSLVELHCHLALADEGPATRHEPPASTEWLT